jgi:SAM-dependent methyltransferase
LLVIARQMRGVEVKSGALWVMSNPIAAYDRQASELAGVYESLSFEDCHRDVLDFVPERPGLFLDVGAGSGRDAGWFAGSGWDVVAVEPAEGMRREGQQRHPKAPIHWLSDRLPGLEAVHRLGLMFECTSCLPTGSAPSARW